MVVRRLGASKKAKPPHELRDPTRRPVFAQGPPAVREADKLPATRDDGYSGALRLLRDIRENRIDARTLTSKQRRACLALLMNQQYSGHDLALLFKVDLRQVYRDMSQVRKEAGAMVREWSIEEVAGQLVLAADRFSARALAHEDVALAWTIQKDLVKTLKDIGCLGKADGDGRLKITIEAMGQGYERATAHLSKIMSPDLTGEVIDVEAETPPGLPGPVAYPEPEAEDPGITVVESPA